MKNLNLVILILLLCACNQHEKQTYQPVNVQEHTNNKSNINLSQAQSEELIRHFLDDKELITKQWSSIKKAFPDGCKLDKGTFSELKCPSPPKGVKKINLDLSTNQKYAGWAQITFTNEVDCSSLIKLATQYLGKGREMPKVNQCAIEWDMAEHLGGVSIFKSVDGDLVFETGIPLDPEDF